MLTRAKLSAPPADEISTAALLDRLAAFPSHCLIFNYEGRNVPPRYHVTEVKNAAGLAAREDARNLQPGRMPRM